MKTYPELWKPIPGFEGRYSVSTHGRVLSHPRVLHIGPNGGTRTFEARILKPVLRLGYEHVNLRQLTHKVHRLVARVFLPNPENKHSVNHKDGNPRNNHVLNLEWATRSENLLHAFRMLKRPTGGRGKWVHPLPKRLRQPLCNTRAVRKDCIYT